MIKIVSKTDLVKCIKKVRNAGDKERSNDRYKQASILVLFINDEIKKNSSILMIKRRDNLRQHAGQIAFPGGKKEKDDLNLEETAKIHLYPLINDTMARLNPVFPDVVSIMVSPGLRIPFFSALSTICKAILSLEEWPGLEDSSLARIVPL